MKYPIQISFFLLLILPLAAQEISEIRGIKRANIAGADVSLMTNHDPASQLENFELLDGYQVNLFAADPMLANPVHMTWDARGRLWVACSWAYPQLRPGEVANDKIIILEDTDNDGTADKSTVFADGLYVPTGLELANGGCYVGQSPDIFFLKDTDGDDVADVREVALTGFGIEDSHHSISAWRRGPGGWIYFQEGIFLNTQVETQYGLVRNFNGGVYQFNPRTQELRLFCRGTGGNPWGHVFDQWGQSFMVNNPRIMYLSPATGNSGERVPVKTLISTSKQCGGDIASGSHIGDDLRGQLLTGRFKNRLVVRYEFLDHGPKGSGFSCNVLQPLIRSKHPNFRPVDVKTGPDGAIYVADWYNSIINHAQHDFRDPRRDNEHGRIWRVSHKNRPLVEKPKLIGIPLADLVAHLDSTEDWTRSYARKELSERDPDEVLAAVEAWVDSLDTKHADVDQHVVEAMWAVQNVERVSEKILKRVLDAKSPGARSAGARVLRYWYQGLSNPAALVAKAAGDSFPRTRMEAVLSAGFMGSAEAFTAALHATDHPDDPFVDQALDQTETALEPYWFPAMQAGTLVFASDAHRSYMEARAGLGLGKRLAVLLRNSEPTAREIETVAEQLVTVGKNEDIKAAVQAIGRASDRKIPDQTTLAMLDAFVRLSAQPPKGINRHISGLRKLLGHQNPAIASLAAKNLGAWKAPKASRDLLGLLKAPQTPATVRQAVGLAAGRLGTEGSSLEKLTNADQSQAVRYAAASGLSYANIDQAVSAATLLFAEDPDKVDPVPLLRSILNNRSGGRLLLNSLAAKEAPALHPAVAERVASFQRESGVLPQKVAVLFLPKTEGRSLSKQLLAENQKVLTEDVVKNGDAHRGEVIYRRKAMACTSCHAVSSVGPAIGPNLAAVGAAAGPEYMVESILKPNAAIAEYFETRLFSMKDGSVQLGVVTFRSETEVVVRDSAQAGKEVRLALADVQREQQMPSLMPAGLADQLKNRQEFLDLAKFMSVLGTPGDFAENERPIIRKWRLFAGDITKGLPAEDADWLPAYSTVAGELPATDLAALGEQVFARGFVNVQVAGPISLNLNEPKGVQAWLNETKVEDLSAAIPFPSGRQVLTFHLDRSARTDATPLRVELSTPSGSLAKFQVEGGL